MKIVSGRTASPHVTSQQFRQMLEGIIGQGSYIVTSGENLKPELSSNNLLKIRSGMMCHHGCISSVDIGTYDEVTLTNGSQGMKRIDLIVNRYTRNAETEVENCSWKVLQGTPVASNPAVPAYTSGNLQDGDLVDDCPAFEVHYDGINVTEVKSLLSVTDGLSELNSKLKNAETTINNNLTVTECSFALNSSNINTSTQHSRVQCFKIGHIAFINGVIKINKAINAYSPLRIGTGFPKLHSSYLYNACSSSFSQDGTYASCFAEINKNGDLDLDVRFQKTAVGDIFHINMCYICQ